MQVFAHGQALRASCSFHQISTLQSKDVKSRVTATSSEEAAFESKQVQRRQQIVLHAGSTIHEHGRARAPEDPDASRSRVQLALLTLHLTTNQEES